MSDKDKHLHTDFKISKGESLFFTDLEKLLVQEVFFADECRLNDISYGIKDGQMMYFGKATPGQENYTKGFDSITNVEKLNANSLWISEVSATSPARSDDMDWVELYNDSENDVELSNYYLSNDLDKPMLFQLSGIIDAKSYKVFYASKDSTKQGDDVIPFSISLAGESLLLSDKNGYGYDFFETGALRLNITSGRATNDYSGERMFFTTPTKNRENDSGITGYSPTPVFSMVGGFYSDSITLEISCADANSKIYYTTNGSAPTNESTLYSAPITISSTTVLSAISYSENKIISEKVVATYLIEKRHSLPVVCLSINKNDFNQVYAVKDKSGPIVERECYIEYFDKDGSLGTSFPAGVRVAGNSTRVYAQKSLALYLRGAYGRSSVTYPFFEDYPITRFSSLVLRNAGQNLSGSRIADAYCSMLMKGMNVDYAETRFVVVYINGSYYGIYDLKENQNEDFYASRYGINRSTMNVIRRNLGVLAGSNTQIKEVYSMAQSLDLSNQSNYERFCKYVDADAFIDYIIAQSYIGNADMFNQKFANAYDYAIKWRPVFYDLDFGFSYAGTDILSKFFTGAGVPSPDGSLTNMYIPTALKKNEGWRNKLIERYAECIKERFSKADKLLEKMITELEPEMQRHIERWHRPSNYATWLSSIDNLRGIVAQRPEIMKTRIKRYFNLSDARMAELFG
ncbi:MAG: hypothetical protein GX802_08075 [Clostridiales bacterium]|nr:hypothetical protein [Clostridiales bacterium]